MIAQAVSSMERKRQREQGIRLTSKYTLDIVDDATAALLVQDGTRIMRQEARADFARRRRRRSGVLGVGVFAEISIHRG